MSQKVEFTRSAEMREFRCGRCNSDKKSKNTGKWTKEDGTVVEICNGCCGWLKANGAQWVRLE